MSLFTSRVARAALSTTLLTGALAAGVAAPAAAAPYGQLDVGTTEARPPAPPTTGRDAPFATSQTFTLHSKPGAKRTIYIDFNGATVTGTQWNDQGVPTTPLEGFSMDSNFSTYNAAEHELMQKTWQLVAEDYAPFDIDVTTEQPPAASIDRSGAADDVYGTTVVVTANRDAHAAEGTCAGGEGCTGVAYLDVFSETNGHAFSQPAWVFTAFNNDLRNIADSVSHEAGHNFGLNHDGKGAEDYYAGHGIWYPIMGSGTSPVGQWSNGAYSGATEKQDDVAKIATHAPFRTDEAGADIAGAATTIPATGIITQRTDVDVFRLPACAGPLTLTAAAAPFSPNLDIELKLLGADGATLATNNPTAAKVSGDDFTASGMGASITFAEAAGKTLYARVDGVGNGTVDTGYDDYGSIGQYTLTPSCTAAPDTAPGPVTGLSAVAVGATAVTATWTAPTGAAATGYKVSLNGGAVETLPAGTTSKTFTGLTPATAYTVSVVATNAKGDSAAATATATTLAEGTVTAPSAPQGLAAELVSDEEGERVLISWSAPTSNGGEALTGYQLFIDGQAVSQPSASSTSTVIGGFSPGTHTIELCAANSKGCGPKASTTVDIPSVQEPLGAPTITKAKFKRNFTKLVLGWTEVEGATGYAIVFLNRRGIETDVFDAGDVLGGVVKMRDVSSKATFVAIYAYDGESAGDLSEAVRL